MELTLVLSLLSIVVAAQGQTVTQVKQTIDNSINQVCNELLGVPCKVTPPPTPITPLVTPTPPSPAVPPPYGAPTPAPAVPPTVPPTPVPAPTVAPPTVVPAPAPVTPAPIAPAPVAPAPVTPIAPSPVAGSGFVQALLSILTPPGVVLTSDQIARLAVLIQNEVADNGFVTLRLLASAGRRLLDDNSVQLQATGVKLCQQFANSVNTYVKSGQFAVDAQGAGVPVTQAELDFLACTGGADGDAVVSSAVPGPAPGPVPSAVSPSGP